MPPAFSIAISAIPGRLPPAELARIERDVQSGGLFVAAASYELHARGEVVFHFAQGAHRVDASVVFASPQGVGLELALDPAARAQLCAKLSDARAASSQQTSGEVPEPAPPERSDEERGEADGATDAADADALSQPALLRLRNLSAADQVKVAQRGEFPERVALERLYGKLVWEPLLRNPRVTVPEVIRIAKMIALPRPLIDLIVSNATWLAVAELRRALLSNPRLPVEHIPKILRVMPRHELKLLLQQTAYPHAVRTTAMRLLGI